MLRSAGCSVIRSMLQPPTGGRKCWAERDPFIGEGSISAPSPVQEIIFERRKRAQERRAQCASHVTLILNRPALQCPFSSEGSKSIPSPVKRIQAPQSKHIADDDEDEWEVIAEYATNHQQAMDAHDIVDDIYRHAEKLMYESGMVVQPDYVGKQ